MEVLLAIAGLILAVLALFVAIVALTRAGDTQNQIKRLRNAVTEVQDSLPGKFDALAKDLGARLAQQVAPPPPPAQEQAPAPEEPAEEVLINFDCPACGQNIDAPDTMVGMNVACPTCSKIISVPAESGATSAIQEVAEGIQETAEGLGPGVSSPDGDLPEDAMKGATVRIDIGQLFEEMEPPKRQIIIKRRGPGE